MQFIRDSQPLIVVCTFLTYPNLVSAALRPLRCAEPLIEKDPTGASVDGIAVGGLGRRLVDSPDVECYQPGDPLFWISVFCLLMVGLGVPAGFGFMLWKGKDRFHDPRFQKTWGFLMSGYEIDRSAWECLILVRKSSGRLIGYQDEKDESS